MIPRLNNDEWLNVVLGDATDVSIKNNYGVDTRSYDWVKDFVRDQKLRKEISDLQNQIKAVQNGPMHKDEVAALFRNGLINIRAGIVEQLKAQALNVQQRRAAFFSEFHPRSLSPLAFNVLSESEIDDILSVLGEGKKEQEIADIVKGLHQEINKRKVIIETELSPQNRWLHFTSGWPVPYPKGCKWTIFVEDWKKVCVRFKVPVTIEGYLLETAEEHMAYKMLELDKLYRHQSQEYLRKPRGEQSNKAYKPPSISLRSELKNI